LTARILWVLAALAVTAIVNPAHAQAPYSWTGFYIGGHAGYGWANQSWTQLDNNQNNALDRSISDGHGDGFLGGFQAGFNQQFGAWVAGIEGDWSWTKAEGCAGLVIFATYSNCAQAQWYSTVTGRVG
jgi:outer membrane immunogenic protein